MCKREVGEDVFEEPHLRQTVVGEAPVEVGHGVEDIQIHGTGIFTGIGSNESRQDNILLGSSEAAGKAAVGQVFIIVFSPPQALGDNFAVAFKFFKQVDDLIPAILEEGIHRKIRDLHLANRNGYGMDQLGAIYQGSVLESFGISLRVGLGHLQVDAEIFERLDGGAGVKVLRILLDDLAVVEDAGRYPIGVFPQPVSFQIAKVGVEALVVGQGTDIGLPTGDEAPAWGAEIGHAQDARLRHIARQCSGKLLGIVEPCPPHHQ